MRVLVVAFGLLLAACPKYGPAPCVVASSEPCACSNGDEGVRVCGANMQFGACTKNGLTCTSSRDGGTSNQNRDGGGIGPGAQDGGAANRDGGTTGGSGSYDYSLRFRAPGATTGTNCVDASANTIHMRFYDHEQTDLLRDEDEHICGGAAVRYSRSENAGTYHLVVDAFDGQGRHCYTLTRVTTITENGTDRADLILDAHPNGVANGCVYPAVGSDGGARDGGTTSGTTCTNFVGEEIDTGHECTGDNTFCVPDTAGSETGTCTAGDACDVRNQTGCGTGTCHAAGAFALDNQNGRFCENAAASGGGHLESCTTVTQCAKGYRCFPIFTDGSSGCLKYCTPGVTSGAGSCQGISGQDGGVAYCHDLLVDAPAAITSIPIGLCL